MDKKELRLLLLCIIISGLSGCIVYWLVGRQQHKIAVVDAVKLFDGYNMKKELEGMAKTKLQAESRQLDSMDNIVQKARAIGGQQDELRKLAYVYADMKSKLKDDYTQSNHDINEQVWKRLNPLLDEYGKENGLHLIIGANGMGSVLYNDEYYDRTTEVIAYVNKQYAGGN